MVFKPLILLVMETEVDNFLLDTKGSKYFDLKRRFCVINDNLMVYLDNDAFEIFS